MNADIVDLFHDWAELAIRHGSVSPADVFARAEWLEIPYDIENVHRPPTSQTEDEAVAGALAMQDWLKTRPT